MKRRVVSSFIAYIFPNRTPFVIAGDSSTGTVDTGEGGCSVSLASGVGSFGTVDTSEGAGCISVEGGAISTFSSVVGRASPVGPSESGGSFLT